MNISARGIVEAFLINQKAPKEVLRAMRDLSQQTIDIMARIERLEAQTERLTNELRAWAGESMNGSQLEDYMRRIATPPADESAG